jgi:methylated-DNA-protein-cysteine methyltransferase-like protein
MISGAITRMPGKANLLALLRTIPFGRVTTFDVLAENLGQPPALVHLMLSGLTEDERDFAPWHRVVANGGAIGRGLHRDQQFARLVREGVPVSPAGIVQDMPRVLVTTFEARSREADQQPESPPKPPQPQNRSRGMKSRP